MKKFTLLFIAITGIYILAKKNISFDFKIEEAVSITSEEDTEEAQDLRTKTKGAVKPQSKSNAQKALKSPKRKPSKIPKFVTHEQHIKRFSKTAILESEKYGVPASIYLGQSLLEANAGNSKLAYEANNYFGHKCFRYFSKTDKCPRGHCDKYEDNDKDDRDQFIIYENAWASFRGHSLKLSRDKGRQIASYGWMIKKYPVGSKDCYINWAYGLKECGYSMDKNYAKKLIRVIESYKLYEYDNQVKT